MNRFYVALTAGILSLALLAGCGAPAEGSSQPTAEPSLTCRIVDGAEEGTLLLADQNSSAVYCLPLENIPVQLDGAEAAASDLTDGMLVEVAYSGEVQETYPALLGEVTQLRAQTPDSGEYMDICGLYLQVLEDLWAVDAGLNDGEDVAYIGVDLSQAPGYLTDSEKAAVALRFAEQHEKELVSGTWDELADQGYIDREKLQWEDGVLFSIRENGGHENACRVQAVLFFDAEKWRSGSGAYFLNDCTCVWPESGPWSTYTVGSQAIS